MQILYQAELTAAPVRLVIERFWQSRDTSGDRKPFELGIVEGLLEPNLAYCRFSEHDPFALALVEGTAAHMEAIDTVLQNTSTNWQLHRMPVVDLSILRCATYEILYLDDIDPAISINEALEIAKSYSTPASPKFINGILDTIQKNPDRSTSPQVTDV